MSSTSDVEHHYNHQSTGFLTPQPKWRTRRCSAAAPASERKPRASNERFHAIHKVPSGDSPYVRAKHVQLLDKNPSKAVSLFWSAINSGDRVESALKDMAVVMKQLDRSEEAIEAIKSFRHLCPPESQESIDNLLLELYKVAGKYEEEIEMLLLKVKQVEEEFAFAGKRTKIARSQGRKIEITIEKEYSRLLGNLAWAYMQQQDFKSAEENYRKALSFESDKNKQCNLALCLMHMNKLVEAKFLLRAIHPSDDAQTDESFAKSYERASQTLADMESQRALKCIELAESNSGFCCQQNRDDCQTPPVPRFLDKTTKRMSTDIPYEKEPDFGRKSYYRSYNSPCSNRETPRAPFTQPRGCPWSFNNRDQRKSEERFCQKLHFGPSTEGRNGQSLMDRNPCNYSADYSASPRVQLPSPRREWRKNSMHNLEKAKKGPQEPFKRNENLNQSSSFVYHGNSKPASECDLAPDSTSTADSTMAETAFNMEPVQSRSFSSIRVSDTENVNTCDPQTGHSTMFEFSMSGQKKSWADLVEEDEQEPENWRQQFTVDFAESGGIKMSCETPHQVQKSSEEFESLEAGGYFTQPEKVNQKVKRSLCFGQGNDNCTSPFKTGAFGLEGH